MRTQCLLILFFSIAYLAGFAQDFQLVSIGAEYNQQSYFNFKDASEVRVDNDAWDIGFHFPSAGIFVNESSKTTFLSPAREVRIYEAPTNDFNQSFTSDQVGERLWNSEDSWELGAFNVLADPNQANDVGWGRQNSNGDIQGDKVFAIRLRSGNWKKIFFESKTVFEYNFKIANLDGTGARSVAISIPDFPGEFFAYFDVENNRQITNIPARWDLVFKRYVTPLDDMQGGILDYTVTGALTFPGTQVARATHIDPFNIELAAYQDSFYFKTDLIGHDWKEFDFVNSNEYEVLTDRAYFIRTTSGQTWKLVFIDFEGFATGNIVFQKWLLETSSTNNRLASKPTFSVFSNPMANGRADLLLKNCSELDNIELILFNQLGQPLKSVFLGKVPDFQPFTLDVSNLPSGNYIVTLKSDQFLSSHKVICP